MQDTLLTTVQSNKKAESCPHKKNILVGVPLTYALN